MASLRSVFGWWPIVVTRRKTPRRLLTVSTCRIVVNFHRKSAASHVELKAAYVLPRISHRRHPPCAPSDRGGERTAVRRRVTPGAAIAPRSERLSDCHRHVSRSPDVWMYSS